MPIRLGIVMDPIATIKRHKDTSFAMLLAAQRRGFELQFMELTDLGINNGTAIGRMRSLAVNDNPHEWYRLGEPSLKPLTDLDIILMRKDPPVDMAYLHATQILDLAEANGTLIANRPQALRDANEKLAATWFPSLCPPTLVTSESDQCRAFLTEHGEAVIKPLDAMGGASIYRLRRDDPNLSVILESMTSHGREAIMVQRFIPDYTAGDKRILLIGGTPIPFALARIPAAGESRANLAAGGRGVGIELTDRDRHICNELGPTLRQKGLYFVGIDVIGEYLTEINVTSPTCVRELDACYGLDIAAQFLDYLTTLNTA